MSNEHEPRTNESPTGREQGHPGPSAAQSLIPAPLRPATEVAAPFSTTPHAPPVRTAAPGRLPFDPWRLCRSVGRRWYWLVLGAVASAAIAGATAFWRGHYLRAGHADLARSRLPLHRRRQGRRILPASPTVRRDDGQLSHLARTAWICRRAGPATGQRTRAAGRAGHQPGSGIGNGPCDAGRQEPGRTRGARQSLRRRRRRKKPRRAKGGSRRRPHQLQPQARRDRPGAGGLEREARSASRRIRHGGSGGRESRARKGMD